MIAVAWKALLSAVLVSLIGCKNISPDTDLPAIIEQPTEASRQALQETVNAIFGTKVLLAPDALTDASVLYIEPRMSAPIGEEAVHGRILQDPLELHLVTNGTNCILIDQRDDSRHILADTRCVAEK